ncbi:MAG: major facilitator superfamily 1 [Frankiales bacterium]|nr:major facilitator superfamily 1 [Frankiales bacterium]
MTDRFPGWRVVGAVAVLLCCVSGFGFYSLAVYVHALTTGDGPFSLSVVSRATSLYLLSTGLAGVGAAALLARRDARLVLAGGAVVMATGLALVGRVSEPWQLYGAYVLLGLGQAGAGLVPGTTVVARWFVVRRGPAMALASTGLSVGGIAVAPLVAALVSRHPLSTVTPVAALVFLVLCLLATAAVVPDPAGRGLAPDGGLVGDTPVEPDGVTRAVAVRTSLFWGISAAQTLAVLAQVGGLTHLYSLVSERTTEGLAGAALSCVAVGSFGGRFLGGLVLARVSSSMFFRQLLVVQSASLLVLATGGGPRLLLGAALVFGLTIGNVLLVHPLLLGEVFGLRDFARVLSLSGLVATAGVTCGPLVVGLVRGATGSYLPGYLVAGSASLLGAAVLHLTVRSGTEPVRAHLPRRVAALSEPA